MKWFCDVLGHPQYAERTDFLAHMSRDHGTTFNNSQLTLLPDMFQCASRSQDGICNFCKRPCARLKSHVSRHLQQIALFALPRVNETEKLNSRPSGQSVRSLAEVKGSQSSGSAPNSELSVSTHTQERHPEGSETSDPVDQVSVLDAVDLPLKPADRSTPTGSTRSGSPPLPSKTTNFRNSPSPKHATNIEPPQAKKASPGNEEILIAVMGATGSGKSHFCRAVTGDEGTVFGDGPKSCNATDSPLLCVYAN